jgi:hypothetical protein
LIAHLFIEYRKSAPDEGILPHRPAFPAICILKPSTVIEKMPKISYPGIAHIALSLRNST